ADLTVGSNFSVAVGTGNTVIGGTADVTGDLDVGGGSFTVAAATGNTVVGGTLTQSSGQVTLNGNVDATNGLDVTNAALTANAGATLSGTVAINDVAAANTTTIGNNTASNTINLNAPAINAPNLPTGTAGDNIVSIDGS